MDTISHWDKLHENPRFRPVYPDGRVVSWVFRNFPLAVASGTRILDLGAGAGRHSVFLAENGYQVSACDVSARGLEELRLRAAARELEIAAEVCGADKLCYADNSFDGVVSFGVLYYLSAVQFKDAVEELRRVLKRGGKALLVMRGVRDSRRAGAEPAGGGVYHLGSIKDGAPSDAEAGLDMIFLDRADIDACFKGFREVKVDSCLFSSDDGKFLDDDWHITLLK